MMRFPCVERVRRFQDRPIALDRFDFAGNRRHDPVADFVEHEKCVVYRLCEHFRPDDARGSRFHEFHRHRQARTLTAIEPPTT
jgi:hypothetical protein